MSEWPMVKLGEVCRISIGKTPARKEPRYWGDGLPWLSIKDMNQGPLLNTTSETITDTALSELNISPYPAGTVLFSFKLSIGKVGITTKPMFTNEAIAAIEPHDIKSLDKPYLAEALRFIGQSLEGNAAVMGITLNKKSLAEINIPLAPLGEQNRITKILGKVAESTRKIESELELLGRLPLFDWSWTGENQKLADVVIVRSGTVDPTLPENQKLLLIAPDSIERDTGNLLELKTCEEAGVTSGKYHFHRGDVLYSKIRPYLNKVAIAPCDGLCSADMYALETKGNLTPETLQAILMSRQFLAYTSQTSGRASIPKVNRKTLLAYEVPKLSDAQIFEITKKIQTVNKVRALLHQKLALLKELQYSLSARAFAGQL
jgi:hypothetical protein